MEILCHKFRLEGMKATVGLVTSTQAVRELQSRDESIGSLGFMKLFSRFMDHYGELTRPLYDEGFSKKRRPGKTLTMADLPAR